jgi:hypothetical protein
MARFTEHGLKVDKLLNAEFVKILQPFWRERGAHLSIHPKTDVNPKSNFS